MFTVTISEVEHANSHLLITACLFNTHFTENLLFKYSIVLVSVIMLLLVTKDSGTILERSLELD